jgi:hypothetical protein
MSEQSDPVAESGEPAPHDVPMVRSSELWDLLGRYPWMLEKWQHLSEASQQGYDDWVFGARTKHQALHRAQVVARRTWTGRPWTDSRLQRLREGFVDYFKEAPEVPPNAGLDPTTMM